MKAIRDPGVRIHLKVIRGVVVIGCEDPRVINGALRVQDWILPNRAEVGRHRTLAKALDLDTGSNEV